MLNKNRIRTKSGTPNLGTCLNALLKQPSISEDYRYVLWSRWTRQRLLRLHSPMREWQSLSNVCRCSWWRLCGVFFLSCLLSSDVPPRPTTLHIFLALGSQPISNVSGQNWWSPSLRDYLQWSSCWVGSLIQIVREGLLWYWVIVHLDNMTPITKPTHLPLL